MIVLHLVATFLLRARSQSLLTSTWMIGGRSCWGLLGSHRLPFLLYGLGGMPSAVGLELLSGAQVLPSQDLTAESIQSLATAQEPSILSQRSPGGATYGYTGWLFLHMNYNCTLGLEVGFGGCCSGVSG